MTDPLMLFATTALPNIKPIELPRQPKLAPVAQISQQADLGKPILHGMPRPERVSIHSGEFSRSLHTPRSGSQLFALRLSALRIGRLYTRLPMTSFYEVWSKATTQLNYDQWRWLLQREASVVARAQAVHPQKHRQLGILLGDSLSLWFPSDRLPQTQLWLNQSISGDTTQNILRRLSDFAATRPRVVYLMAGVNDLKNGATDTEVLGNLRQIIAQLQYQHPQAQIVVQSLLPTRMAWLTRDRAVLLNQQLAAIAEQMQVQYLDLYDQMTDAHGNLHPDLTTDGLHLSAKGYAAWQQGLQQSEIQIARRS
jgi:lysophospholipase L1-like esterase